MKRSLSVLVALLLFVFACGMSRGGDAQGWIGLFNGRTLDGWKVGRNAATFEVENGMIASSVARLEKRCALVAR